MNKTIATLAKRAAVIAMVGAMLSMSTGVAQARDKGKSGKLNLAETETVGNLVLQPGEYEVKVKDSASGTELEFARWTTNPYAQEGMPVYDREVVGSVKAIEQTATGISTRTGLLLAGGGTGKPVGVQIRGNSVQYLFDSQMARTDAQTSGQQETIRWLVGRGRWLGVETQTALNEPATSHQPLATFSVTPSSYPAQPPPRSAS